jgi:hypothetical protein
LCVVETKIYPCCKSDAHDRKPTLEEYHATSMSGVRAF